MPLLVHPEPSAYPGWEIAWLGHGPLCDRTAVKLQSKLNTVARSGAPVIPFMQTSGELIHRYTRAYVRTLKQTIVECAQQISSLLSISTKQLEKWASAYIVLILIYRLMSGRLTITAAATVAMTKY
jgi:hypothetical protein